MGKILLFCGLLLAATLLDSCCGCGNKQRQDDAIRQAARPGVVVPGHAAPVAATTPRT